jgi:hypothetical protein
VVVVVLDALAVGFVFMMVSSRTRTAPRASSCAAFVGPYLLS